MIYRPNEWINIKEDARVLIIGSGAAGLSLALKLEKLKIPSLIIEGGNSEYSDESQEIYNGEIVSKHDLAYGLKDSRMRYFGGSTNCWAGLCGEFDEEDFLERDWINLSGWPIFKKDLDPYYNEASKFLNIDRKKITHPNKYAKVPNLEGFQTRSLYNTFIGSFGILFDDHLKKSKLITIYLAANCTRINQNTINSNLIDSVNINSFDGVSKLIKSKNIILCCGGIENARLLLNTKTEISPAIGNHSDMLGKYFSEHPIAPCATVIGPNGKIFNMKQNWHQADNDVKAYYKIPFEIQKKFNISNSAIHFFEQEDELTKSDLSAINLYKFFKDYKNSRLDKNDFLEIIKNPIDVLSSYRQRKKRSKIRTAVRFTLEQTPNEQSKIYLGNQLDKFGQRKIKLDWKFNKIERRTVNFLMAYTADVLQKNKIGTLKMDSQLYNFKETLPLDLRGGQHHCGTTRMAISQKNGVVDKDLKVFGMKNLFVCGSSVYPTNSWVNPTFTIIALSLRLADNISNKFNN